jgi:D-beta-D-heptose 7-phosphate kinase/D-beta-D-heptose 1-phosphate adenosyltransferase
MTSEQTPDSLAECLADFRNRRLLVVGDAIVDEYLLGDCSRLSPEAPVPVVKVNSSRRVLGGAANTAANIVSLGGRATLIALVGHDDAGATLRDCAQTVGVDLEPVDHGHSTLRKTRIIGQQQQVVRLDFEDLPAENPALAAAVLERFDASLRTCDAVIISDYAKGCVSPLVAQGILRRARASGRPVIIDPRPQNRDCYHGCDYLTPNWRESRGLLGWEDASPNDEAVETVARTLVARLDTNVVLTLGPHGICFCSRNGDEVFALPTLAREVFDVSGAGDTVVAAFTLALASGASHRTAVTLANKAASVVVSKFGTATVTPEEILEQGDGLRIVPRHALAALSASLRARGRRIVTITGTFDLLHDRHVHILNEARRRGDVLVVGLTSDASVRSSRGPGWPLMPERSRAEMLLALRMVDFVHIVSDAEPTAFLAELRPDVHVDRAEYGDDSVNLAGVCESRVTM